MKNVALMVISVLIWTLTLTIVMAVSGRMNRSMELQGSLPSVLEETVENMTISRKYGIQNQNEFIADLAENLFVTFDTDSDITIKVLKSDRSKGILGIQVTGTFQHPNGRPGTVSCERTVILNQLMVQEPQECKIRFMAEGEVYKAYTVLEGEVLTAPVNPSFEGKQFLGWKDGNGYLADFTEIVTGERTYYAEWGKG